jgi:NAD(P)-dependent dehydrogenase (short-subunit alcohol dehydrogenase family)
MADSTQLEGKVALVTGASSGIGAATAKLLGSKGATVAAVARRKDLLDKLGAAETYPVDLSDPLQAQQLAADVEDAHGRVDILVNNAAVRVDGSIDQVSVEDLDSSFQLNALTPFVLAGRLLPGMKDRGEGVIANVVAPKVSGGRKEMGAYAASKAALESTTQTLRQEAGGSSGVAVFAFDPGWVKTDLAPDGTDTPEAAAERLVAHIEAGKGSRDILS